MQRETRGTITRYGVDALFRCGAAVPLRSPFEIGHQTNRDTAPQQDTRPDPTVFPESRGLVRPRSRGGTDARGYRRTDPGGRSVLVPSLANPTTNGCAQHRYFLPPRALGCGAPGRLPV